MLIEFRIGNFRSFDEPQTFSLVASSDTRHPDNCIPFGKLQLLKSAAVYGANASGKSNLIRAIDFMRRFVLYSATTMNVGDEIPVVPFQLHPDSRGKASFFEAAFVVGGVRYQYGFTATSKRVQDEWLIAYPKGRPQHLLERRFNTKTEQPTWAFRGELQKEGTLLKERTRDNGLVLSRGAELNVAPLTTVFLWFRQKMAVLDLSTSPTSLIDQTAMRLKDDATFRERVLRLIRHADLGISDLEVSEEQSRVFSGSVPARLSGRYAVVLPHWYPTMATGAVNTAHVPTAPTIRSIHRSADGEAVPFDFLEAESNGTQRFFALAGPWLDALDQGALLVIDELDCSMHPSLTWKLVELFQTSDANPHGAQLVFSTHDSTLMDLELFRRDQIWIVEKDRAGASRLSSLYDFEEKPRNNEAVQQRYLAGRYGGVPVFGPTFEDLELK
ncbi:MAG: AAA family ATPase [Gemmataceae bacterium]|nr:AAA family ATPase [Gemmataceae bacterium]